MDGLRLAEGRDPQKGSELVKVGIVNSPSEVRVIDGKFQMDGKGEFALDEKGNRIWIEGECRILREDVEAAKEFCKELMKETNPRIRQQWEKSYYDDLKERYCSAQVAGAMLMKVWDWTKEQKEEE